MPRHTGKQHQKRQSRCRQGKHCQPVALRPVTAADATGEQQHNQTHHLQKQKHRIRRGIIDHKAGCQAQNIRNKGKNHPLFPANSPADENRNPNANQAQNQRQSLLHFLSNPSAPPDNPPAVPLMVLAGQAVQQGFCRLRQRTGLKIIAQPQGKRCRRQQPQRQTVTHRAKQRCKQARPGKTCHRSLHLECRNQSRHCRKAQQKAENESPQGTDPFFTPHCRHLQYGDATRRPGQRISAQPS